MRFTLFELFFISFASATTLQFNHRSTSNPNNVFNQSLANTELQRIQNKYNHFRPAQRSAKTKDSVVSSPSNETLKALQQIKNRNFRNHRSGRRQTVEPLLDDNDAAWLGGIQIGTPRQGLFELQFDTGSSDIWLPSVSCQDCEQRVDYNASASSTHKSIPGNFSIEYLSGQSASGPLVEDTVSIGLLTVTNQVFSPVENVTSGLADADYVGIIGLALPALSVSNTTNFVHNAWKQGIIDRDMFGMRLGSDNGSFISFGEADDSLFTGQIEIHPLSRDDGFWIIGDASLNVNSSAIATNFETVIDSGSTKIYAPSDVAETFYAQIPGARALVLPPGFYTFPCNATLPTISFNWGDSGQKWEVSAEKYEVFFSPDQSLILYASFNSGPATDGSLECIGGLVGQDLDIWILGDVFMKNVYAVFEADTMSVGLAQLSEIGGPISTNFNGATRTKTAFISSKLGSLFMIFFLSMVLTFL